jgi:hypothetical protein
MLLENIEIAIFESAWEDSHTTEAWVTFRIEQKPDAGALIETCSEIKRHYR